MGSLVQGVEQGGCGFPDLADKYVTVVQAVLLYGLEKWMMTLRIGRVGGLQDDGTTTLDRAIW